MISKNKRHYNQFKKKNSFWIKISIIPQKNSSKSILTLKTGWCTNKESSKWIIFKCLGNTNLLLKMEKSDGNNSNVMIV